MTNGEKFLELVSEDESNTMEWAKEQNTNWKLRRAAQKISILILKRLKELGWSQRELAEKMDVSPQLVNKWVKGKENNFSFEILFRIGDYLGIDLIEIPLKKLRVEVSSQLIESSETYEKRELTDVCKAISLSSYTTSDISYESNNQELVQRISQVMTEED